jgi:hypothetical protein
VSWKVKEGGKGEGNTHLERVEGEGGVVSAGRSTDAVKGASVSEYSRERK